MTMNAVTTEMRVSKLKDVKPPEQLEHLYVDGADQIRDRHVEDMWMHLHLGKPLDDIFKANFFSYFTAITGNDPTYSPPAIFDNVIQLQVWIAHNFGLLHVQEFNPFDYEPDESLADFTHCARLRSRYATMADEYCYAGSELYAMLLSVVNVYRHAVTQFIDRVSNP